MKIRIYGYESPHVLRALATLLTTLADEPMRAGCPEPCDKPVNDVPGRATAYEPFDIFPADVMGGNHEERSPRVPPPPSGYEVHDETFVSPTGLVISPLPTASQNGTATSAGAALDKTGTPWDARIHSSSRALVANGTWRLKKGVDKTLVESVTRELRDPRRAEEIGQTAMFAPIEDALVGRALDAALVPQPPSMVNPAPHAPASTAGVVPPPPLPFNEISRYFAVNSMAGKLTHADMEAMAKHSGVTYTQDLMTAAHASKRPSALAYLQQLVESRTPVNA